MDGGQTPASEASHRTHQNNVFIIYIATRKSSSYQNLHEDQRRCFQSYTDTFEYHRRHIVKKNNGKETRLIDF
jgi:hypothetical protein